MLEYRKFTKEEIDLIVKNMIILVDSREKADTITKWMDYKNRVKYERMKLDNGDYSFYVKPIPELGIHEKLFFDKKVVVERKNSLDELSQNMVKHRTRFEEELATFKGKMVICVEDKWDNLFMGNYRSKYGRRAFISSVQTFEHRYGVVFKHMSAEAMPVFIYTYFEYYLKEVLKGSLYE